MSSATATVGTQSPLAGPIGSPVIFFTTLAVGRSAAAASDSDRVLGNVWLDIQGFENPMTFLVFVEDGFVDGLEGATIEDRTDHIDLYALRSEGRHKD